MVLMVVVVAAGAVTYCAGAVYAAVIGMGTGAELKVMVGEAVCGTIAAELPPTVEMGAACTEDAGAA